MNYPKSIVCLTEESVEILYHLNREDLIVGISCFVERPIEAKKAHPIVTTFTHANMKKIKEISPDLFIGFSDIQKDIARELIGEGYEVYISNQRSLEQILNYIEFIGRIINEQEKTAKYLETIQAKVEQAKNFAKTLKTKPKVYFEEWDEPRISAIQWVSELIELCGGIDINKEKAKGKLAKERFISDEEVLNADPDIIFGCWCGKKVDLDEIKGREAWKNVKAIEDNQVFELNPAVFLQPGPAPFFDGIDILIEYFSKWSEK